MHRLPGIQPQSDSRPAPPMGEGMQDFRTDPASYIYIKSVVYNTIMHLRADALARGGWVGLGRRNLRTSLHSTEAAGRSALSPPCRGRRPKCVQRRPKAVVSRTPYTVHRTPYTERTILHRTPCTVYRTSYVVCRTPFAVPSVRPMP